MSIIDAFMIILFLPAMAVLDFASPLLYFTVFIPQAFINTRLGGVVLQVSLPAFIKHPCRNRRVFDQHPSYQQSSSSLCLYWFARNLFWDSVT